MIRRLAADGLVIIHAMFIAYVALGGFLALKWPWTAWGHLPCAAWGALLEFFGWICPLTPLEVHLRRAAGQAGYSGGFIEHYLLPLVYPDGLTRATQILLGTVVVVINVCVYTMVVLSWRRGRRNLG